MEDSQKPISLDFNTSSSIDRINLSFIFFYMFVFWMGGFLTIQAFLGMLLYIPDIIFLILIPFFLWLLYYVFMFGCILTVKLLLIILKLIHKPRQGVFRIDKNNRVYKYWRLRVQLKKIGVWLLNNCPLPWSDVWAFRWFGVKMDFSSHLADAWVDVEFIKFGRKVTVGQGAVVMSSMIVGNYLIIKESVFDDYTVIGGVSTIAPGTIIGKDTIIGALSSTNYKQVLEEAWIYFGIPGIKLKPNKFAEESQEFILRRDVDSKVSYEEKVEVLSDNKISKEEEN